MSIQSIIAVSLYLIATLALALKISINKQKIYYLFFIGSILALFMHAHLIYESIHTDKGLDFSLLNTLSLVSWLVSLIVMLTSFYRQLENLLLFLFPIAAIMIIFQTNIITEHRVLEHSITNALKFHIFLSICAYSLLTISSIQAVLLFLQEKLIKTKHVSHVIYFLPPLQVMEQLLVQIIIIGFFLLSLSLASGLMFIEDIFAQHLAHKTILSILAWFVYGVLIWGRFTFGWRGKKLITWILSGFFILIMAYIGTKIVLELILNRL